MVDFTFAVTGQYFGSAAWKALTDDVKKATDKVEALGRTPAMDKLEASTKGAATGVSAIQSRIDGLIGSATKFAASFTAAWAVNQVLEFGEGIQKAAVDVATLSKQTNLSTNEVQALQQLAARTKRPFDELAQTYAKNQAELDKLTGKFVETGQAIDTHAVAKFAELDRKATESANKMEESMNRVKAAIAPLYAEGKALVLDAAADATDRLVSAVSKLDVSKADMILALLVPGYGATLGARVIAGVADQAATEGGAKVREISADIERLQNNLKAAETRNPQGQRAQSIRAELAQRQTDLANARALQGAALSSRFGGGDNADLNRPVPLLPPGTVPTVTTGGGGSRDRIGENLQQFTAQAEAARIALEALQKTGRNPLIPLDDLERGIKLEKDIADAMATANKYAKDDPRKAQLEEQIRLRETYESGYRRFIDALKLADVTERQYGDGQAARAQQEAQLKDALDTRRLSTQAYDLAIQELGKNTEDLRLKNIGLAGGLPALAAGFENARNQADRANSMFNTGGKLYEQIMSTMTLATQSWGQSFDQVLLNAGASWARFLADMALRAGASSLWNAVGGLSGIGSLFGGGQSIPTIGGGTMNMGSGFTGLGGGGTFMSAGGGPLGAGQSSIVGERGPELFVPNTGGNILNRQQLDALGVGGGGGTVVNVNLGGVVMGEFVSPSQHRRDLMLVQQAAERGAMAGLMKLQRSGDRRMRVSGF